ncbi:MAG: hypothetical protein MI975_14445 [Cytophagales bacterium]|nr:hypothetical protein [Cytophagales bacterium]
MKKVLITCGRLEIEAELFDTKTAKLIINETPLSGTTSIWGGEIYFPVSVVAELEEDATEEVEGGTLAYWPPGKAFCIFFGPTPVSSTSKPRAYSPVNVIGKIHGNLEDLRSISQDEPIKVELI